MQTRRRDFLLSGLLQWDQFVQVVWSIPLIFVGTWLGKLLVQFLQPQQFDKVILVLLAFAAVFLLTR